jgi:hypothetical protein
MAWIFSIQALSDASNYRRKAPGIKLFPNSLSLQVHNGSINCLNGDYFHSLHADMSLSFILQFGNQVSSRCLETPTWINIGKVWKGVQRGKEKKHIIENFSFN